ncbi:MAG: hypothetical protein K0U84_18310 [Actinomycetia bacterium]|nr:hypothetical protein [Actinomycetes bacterium]
MVTWTIHSDGKYFAVLKSINDVPEVIGVYNTREEAESHCPHAHTFVESHDPDAYPA